MSHCPVPPLNPGQIPPSNCSASTVTISDPGVGNRRGICVFIHPSQNSDLPLPLSVPNIVGNNITTFEISMVADGWVFAYPAWPIDWSVKGVSYFGNVYNDVANDAGHGSQFNNTLLLWWDHMLAYLTSLYGSGKPIIIAGFSAGAWAALAIAIGRASSLVGFIAHCPVTLWENITFFNPPYNNSLLTWTGMDLSTTCLTSPAISIPGIIGYSTTDGVAGYSSSSTPVSNTDAILTACSGASLPVTRYSSSTDAGTPYPNGHLFLPGDAAEYCTNPTTTGWVNTVLDPSHPVSF